MCSTSLRGTDGILENFARPLLVSSFDQQANLNAKLTVLQKTSGLPGYKTHLIAAPCIGATIIELQIACTKRRKT